MIIDLQKFIDTEQKSWDELEQMLERLERAPEDRLSIDEIQRFHYLYERASADLARIATFAAERELRQYLESLVARAYGEIHEVREKPHRFQPLAWFLQTFPITFRRHIRAFQLALLLVTGGALFGGVIIMADPAAKSVLMGFPHLMTHPSTRVAEEEETLADRLAGSKAQGAAFYMTHNTRVALTTMALGATWGVGTVIVLISNGIMLGSICVDYIMAGETRFLVGWLLPHGSIEIPAILIAGQAGFVLAACFVSGRGRKPLKARLRASLNDIVTLSFGSGVLLVWAGVVESFLSQYHEPTLPYSLKIGLGIIELALLWLFLSRSGKRKEAEQSASLD
ncbi:MAG: stage II sporulation protein M [Spartobacteria bacterium]|nr:stage II sporulation protein M [Spartobacteria bacterium]